MTFKQYQTNEVFDNPYNWDVYSDYPSIEIEFFDEEGSRFVVFLEDVYFGKNRGNSQDPEYIQTQQSKGEGYLITFTKNNSTKMSSSNAFRVFATIKEIILAHIDELKSGHFVYYTAAKNDRSRVRFYRSMTKQIQKLLGWKYSKEMSHQGDVHFIIHKEK